MIFCQSVLNSASAGLRLNSDGSLDYYGVYQGDPAVPLHRIAYIFLRDALNQYLSVPGNNLPLSEIPRGAYKWSPGAEVELSDYEEDAAYWDSEEPEYMSWEDRYEDGFDE
jgi:hypothetical protein